MIISGYILFFFHRGTYDNKFSLNLTLRRPASSKMIWSITCFMIGLFVLIYCRTAPGLFEHSTFVTNCVLHVSSEVKVLVPGSLY